MTRSWEPIANRTLVDRSEAVLTCFSGLLADLPTEAHGHSLADQLPGLAVAAAHMSKYDSGLCSASRATELLDQAIEAASATQMTPGLFAGASGVGWATEHLRNLGLLTWDANADPNDELDALLASLLFEPEWKGHFDVVTGIAGIGVYIVERASGPVATGQLAERLVDLFDRLSSAHAVGRTWLTRPELLPPGHRERAPQGHYNLGLAHGVPGVVAILSALLPHCKSRDRCSGLIEDSVAWLLSQRSNGQRTAFPFWTAPGLPQQESRLAWCYGDLSVAAALLSAASVLARDDWRLVAVTLARDACRRPVSDSGVVDAGVCHGAAGVAHILNRIAQATGDDELCAAAVRWYERCLSYRGSGGYCGFSAWDPARPDGLREVPKPGLLSGTAGVALAVLGTVSQGEPSWDRCLLVDCAGSVIEK